MYERILVATGGSPWSDAAVAYAIAIAARTGGTLHILTVLTNPAVYATPDFGSAQQAYFDLLWKLADVIVPFEKRREKF